MQKESFFKKVYFSLLISASLFLAGCELFTTDINAFLEYYTGTAAIVSEQLPELSGIASNGLRCVNSNEDQTVNFMIRNPQQYEGLRVDYAFKNEDIQNYVNFNQQYKPVCSESEDTLSLSVTFPKEFLQKLEMGNVKDPTTGEILKDLSGTITVSHPTVLDLEFESYDFSLMVDTAPERVRGACFQMNDKITVADRKYVVCFNVKKLQGSVHEKDTRNLYIGEKHWTFSGNLNNLQDENPEIDNGTLTLTKPTLYNLDGTASSFEILGSDYIPVYFITNVIPAKDTREYSYIIRLVDDDSLLSKAVVSNKSDQLKMPVLSVENGKTYSADSETELYELILNHTRGTWHFDENEENPALRKKDGLPCREVPYITYSVKKSDGSVIFKGTKQAPVSISIPTGKNYSVEAYAICNGYVDSDPIATTTFNISRSNNYYVSGDGNDTYGTGSKKHPYKTISKCAQNILEQQSLFNAKDEYNIYLLTDLISEGSSTTNTFDNLAITGSSTGSSYEVNLIGLGNQKVIDGSNYTGCLTVEMDEASKVCIKNICFQNSNGTGLCISNYNDALGVELENCSVINNHRLGIDNAAGGVTGEFILSNVTVTGNGKNQTSSTGGILYSGKILKIKGKNVITDNYSNNGSGSVPFNLDINKFNNFQKAITIIGSLKDSKIGITTIATPDIGAPVDFTKDYSLYNSGIAPSTIFYSDKDYGVVWTDIDNQTGEACIGVNGSGFGSDLNEEILIQADSEYCYYKRSRNINLRAYVCSSDGSKTEFTSQQYDASSFSSIITVFGETVVPAQSGTRIAIPATLNEMKYFIKVTLKYNGKMHTANLPLECIESVEGLESAPASGTWYVASAVGMNTLSKWTEAGNSLEGVTFILSKDVTLDNTFTPIGKNDDNGYFKGIFNGNNHIVKGLNVASTNGDYGALFGFVAGNAFIKNVTVEGTSEAAGIIGRVADGNVTVQNCVNKATVSKSSADFYQLGGIVAEVNDGNLSILDCVNEGNISGAKYIGGIIGYFAGNRLIIRNCINKGTLTESNNNMPVGGIVGQLSSCSTETRIYNNCNIGTISVTGTTGGIIGKNTKIYCYLQNNFNAYSYMNYGLFGNTVYGVGNNCIYNYYSSSYAGNNSGAAYKVSLNGSVYSTVLSVTVNSHSSSTDLITLLNYWVDDANEQEGSAIYKRWYCDASGNISFGE